MTRDPGHALGSAFAGLLLGDALLELIVGQGIISRARAIEIVDGLVVKCEALGAMAQDEEPWIVAARQLSRTLERVREGAGKPVELAIDGWGRVAPPTPSAVSQRTSPLPPDPPRPDGSPR